MRKKIEYNIVLFIDSNLFFCHPMDYIEKVNLNIKYISYLSSKLKDYNKDIIWLQEFDYYFKQDYIGIFSDNKDNINIGKFHNVYN